VWQGLLVAVGQHTTTALVLNENEELLLRDIEAFFLGLAPPERPWLHNDLHLRQGIPPDEPRNAHAHLIAMMLGNQLSLPVVDGRLGIGRWQWISPDPEAPATVEVWKNDQSPMGEALHLPGGEPVEVDEGHFGGV